MLIFTPFCYFFGIFGLFSLLCSPHTYGSGFSPKFEVLHKVFTYYCAFWGALSLLATNLGCLGKDLDKNTSKFGCLGENLVKKCHFGINVALGSSPHPQLPLWDPQNVSVFFIVPPPLPPNPTQKRPFSAQNQHPLSWCHWGLAVPPKALFGLESDNLGHKWGASPTPLRSEGTFGLKGDQKVAKITEINPKTAQPLL